MIRFVMKDSIEEKMIDLQNSKEALGKGTLQELSKEEKDTAKITHVCDLFEVRRYEDEQGESSWS